MDVSAFSGDAFDAKDWINRALRNSDPTQSKVSSFGTGGNIVNNLGYKRENLLRKKMYKQFRTT